MGEPRALGGEAGGAGPSAGTGSDTQRIAPGPSQLRSSRESLGALGWEESRLSGDLGEGEAGQVQGELPGGMSPLGVRAPGGYATCPAGPVQARSLLSRGIPAAAVLASLSGSLAAGCLCRLEENGLVSPLLPTAPRTASWALNSWVWEPRVGEGLRAVTHSTQPVGVVCSLR